jgi:osmotically-inducible protein OsmY
MEDPMISRRRLTLAVAFAAAGVVLVPALYLHHRNDNAPVGAAIGAQVAAPAENVSAIITSKLQQEQIPLQGVTLTWIDGIVILRGTVDSAAAGSRITDALHADGYKRVANMTQLSSPIDDDTIRRDVERRLTDTRSLDGCHFTVSSSNGVLKVAGTVQSGSQEQAAREILRNVHTARQVETDLKLAGAGL